MTSLTAGAASFFSRSVGCVTGQPGPQDVACGVFVGVGAVPAASTSEYRLGDAVLFGCVPAGFAAVGGVPGIDFDHGASSVFRFGAQNRDELPPARIGDTSNSARSWPPRRWAGTGRGSRGRGRVWPGATCWRSPGSPRRSGRRSLRACGRFCGGSRGGSWRSCDAEQPPSHVGGPDCWTPAWRGPAAAARRPIRRRRCEPSADWAHDRRRRWWRNWRSRHRHRPGGRYRAAEWRARHRRTGSASSAGPRGGPGSSSPAPPRRGAR